MEKSFLDTLEAVAVHIKAHDPAVQLAGIQLSDDVVKATYTLLVRGG